MRQIVFGCIALVLSAVASASWRVETNTDSMTDEKRRSAKTVNAEGHSFSIYRLPSGVVWANFALSSRSIDQLSPQTPPVFRIDKHEPHDIGDSKRLQDMGLGMRAYAWEPKWVNFLVWHGKENEGRAKQLDQLMQGQRLVFRYHLSTGGYKETTFSLAGAGSAIAAALGISAVADKAQAEKIDAFNQAVVDASRACQRDMSTFKVCMEKVMSCGRQSKNDASAFQQCLQ